MNQNMRPTLPTQLPDDQAARIQIIHDRAANDQTGGLGAFQFNSVSD